MKGLAQDLSYAFRSIRRDIRFYLFAALIVGLGVGANTSVFSVMNPLLLKPLPFEDPDELVWIRLRESGGLSSLTSRTSNLRDFRAMNRSFDALTGYFAFFEYESYNLVGEGDPERLVGVGVATDFLDVLGVQPRLGRNFLGEEGLWDGPPAAILTHAFWVQRFGADPGIVGRTLTLNDRPTEVVGVLPASFDFSSTFSPGSRVDFLRPFPISDETDRMGNTLFMIGRLRSGATAQSAQADIDLMVSQLQAADPNRWGLGGIVTPLQEQISGGFRQAVLLLAAAAGAVMLIACANLSNLLLARGPKRQKEMAIRSAMGASRGRLLNQLMLESMLISLAGGVMGILMAWVVTRWVSGATAMKIPMLASVTLDGRVLLFSLAVALAAGVLMGILPAIQVSGGREGSAMREGTRGTSGGRRQTGVREILVVAEVAAACVLLVGGGLLLKSFSQVLNVNLGFRPEGVVAWRVDTNREFETQEERVAFYTHLVDEIENLPGVEAAGLTDCMPLGRNRSWSVRAVGAVYSENERPPTGFPRIVDYRYIPAMGIPLVSGRNFTPDDRNEEAPVIILNETGARRLFAEEDPIGRFVSLWGEVPFEVVGVVADTRHQSLEEEAGVEMYFPMGIMGWGTLDLVVRSPVPMESLVAPVAGKIREVDPEIPTDDHRSLTSVVDRSVSPRRFTLRLLGGFAGMALILAALGIYGVLSYSVSQRVPEIGIRMALGESGGRILGRVVGRTLALAGIGTLLGVVGALGLSRLMASLLYGVEPTDPTIFAGMTFILLLTAGFAGFLPARRASRTDPMKALRAEG